MKAFWYFILNLYWLMVSLLGLWLRRPQLLAPESVSLTLVASSSLKASWSNNSSDSFPTCVVSYLHSQCLQNHQLRLNLWESKNTLWIIKWRITTNGNIRSSWYGKDICYKCIENLKFINWNISTSICIVILECLLKFSIRKKIISIDCSSQ